MTTKIDAFEGVTTDYYDATNPDLAARYKPLESWFQARLDAGVDHYSKFTSGKIAPQTTAFYRDGKPIPGLNFASQDYLSLATHPQVIAQAAETARKYGVHSAGSAALMGLTDLTIELEERLAQFLDVADATVFPTGWGAGYGIIKTLVRETDHVVIDVLAHASLQEGATNATRNVSRFPHLSNEAVERRLQRIRSEHPDVGILVVTETVFSMDSDVPFVPELQSICRRYGALLMVDVAHDLGAIGKTGRGYLEVQDFVGKPDILMGSFSKTFASNGGFVASDRTELKMALRYGCGPLTFTNSLSPVQAATVLACFDIIDSPEGAKRRKRLMANIRHIRGLLNDEGFDVLGEESAIVPVMLGVNASSRRMTRWILEHGGLVNLVEYPAVAKNKCRWRVQVMHDHTPDQIEKFVRLAVEAQSRIKDERTLVA